MIIRASQGCYLTQNDDSINLEDRLFLEHVNVAMLADVPKWKEITEKEKQDMEYEKVFFDVNSVDVDYLHKVNGLHYKIARKINDAELTNEQALEMKQYYPTFEDSIGKEVFVGYKFQCDGVLYEVIKPHVVTAEMRPTSAATPMLMSVEPTTENASDYYKEVTVEVVQEDPKTE